MEQTSLAHSRASLKELQFIRKHAPRGMWKMVEIRTGKTRSQVDYQLRQLPENQDLRVVNAAREILLTITGLSFTSNEEVKDEAK
jgi:hypothetical protein